jgi:hypothetical protein
MTITAQEVGRDIELGADEVGHWFSPAAVQERIYAAVAAERERICAAIKAEDDHCADRDYMLDSDDCIAVARGQWKRPE